MSANRGKYAEDRIKDFLEEWKRATLAFTYNRILDAHASKGVMSNPQPGDFQWFMGLDSIFTAPSGKQYDMTRNGLIESKETEHAFRLPYQSFGVDQVGRMVIRQLAGSECIVLTCHRVKGTRGALWRNVPLDFFRERTGPKFGSWDLSAFPTTNDLASILKPYLS